MTDIPTSTTPVHAGKLAWITVQAQVSDGGCLETG